MADKWMQEAFAHNKGKFSAKAKKAGMSTQAYASKVTSKAKKGKVNTKLLREALLAKTAKKIANKHKGK